MELLEIFKLTPNAIDFICAMIGLFTVGYYVDLFSRVVAKDPSIKKPTKKQFVIGLIPMLFWGLIFIEQISELD